MEKVDLLKMIGSNVKRIRRSKGMSQVDLAGNVIESIDATNIFTIKSFLEKFYYLVLYNNIFYKFNQALVLFY